VRRPRSTTPWWQAALIFPLLVALLPLLLAWGALYLLWSIALHLAIWLYWCGRSRDTLFVYSDSPIWHDYIEQQILPRLGARAVVLNWSQQKSWKSSLATQAFRHFGGHREFNPMAVVFRPFHLTRTFRFWKPFQEYKRGRPQALENIEAEFFTSLK
jgi:hypothetical protein